jgi:predicted dehydrogenase
MVGIGIIGTGYWGKNHVRICKELAEEGIIDVVKLCDLDKQRVRELGDSFAVEYTTNYKDIISDPEIQAVSIVTPSHTHYKIAREFMSAGIDVLIEKPMAMDIQEAKELNKVSKENRCILMAGHIFRYHPAIRELKQRIDAGEFGKIKIIISNRLFLGLPRKDMGVIYALGIHELDMFCYLMDMDYPNMLTATSSTSFQSGIEETCMITMDFGGVKGYALESWLVPVYGKRRDLVLIGSEKSAKIDYLSPQELQLFDMRIVAKENKPVRVEDEGEHSIPIPYAEPLKEELKHYISCVKGRKKPDSDGMVGMRAVVMAEAALKASEKNKFMRFENNQYIED